MYQVDEICIMHHAEKHMSRYCRNGRISHNTTFVAILAEGSTPVPCHYCEAMRLCILVVVGCAKLHLSQRLTYCNLKHCFSAKDAQKNKVHSFRIMDCAPQYWPTIARLVYAELDD
jgi:hypothetical protein